MTASGFMDGHSSLKIGSFLDVARYFAPAWFAVAMGECAASSGNHDKYMQAHCFCKFSGTGAISMLFHSFPYGTDSCVMEMLSLVFFFLNLVLFALFTVLGAVRYLLIPGTWSRMLRNPLQSPYLGTFPMATATLLTVSVTVIYGTYHFGGRPFVFAIWALWWIDAAMSILCCWGVVHVMITRQEHRLESMTLAWLLPAMTLVVGASTGGVIGQTLIAYTPSGALLTFTFSACMAIIGFALIMMLLTAYLLRTILHGYAKESAILSIFFPLGPSGQAAYALLLIGSGLKSLLPLTYGGKGGLMGTPVTGETVNVVCIMTAFALWCFETMWMIMAFLGLWHSLRRAPIPFKLTFWSMIFPNGVYANCTLALGTTFSSPFFRVWGTIYSIATLLLWMYVAGQTLRLCPSGGIFDALPIEEELGQNGAGGRAQDEEKPR